MSDLMDLISQIDETEIDQEIEEGERRLAVLRSIRKALCGKHSPRPKAARVGDDPRAASSISEEIANRVATKALQVLRKRQPVGFHDLRATIGACSPGQLSAALARDWFTKDAAGWSLSAAGEKAIRDQTTLKQGA